MGQFEHEEPSEESLREIPEGDFSKSRPNPYAAKLKDTIAVVLEPDVASVVNSSDKVNEILREWIASHPNG